MDERMSESAAEVIAGVIKQSEDDAYLHGAWNSRPEVDPQVVLDALREAGWIVEKLPEPDHREEATDDENGRTDYEAGDVSVFDDGEIHVFGAVWEPAAVRHFGLSLLAAAAVSQDGER